MTRADLLEAAATKLAEAVTLLARAGEQRLAFEAEALAEQVEFSAARFDGETPSPETRAEDLQKDPPHESACLIAQAAWRGGD